MPLLDVSRVTQAMIRLIEEHVLGSEAWQPRARPVVSARAPDRPADAAATVYLYNAREDPHYRSLPPPLPGSRLGEAPLVLTLHYQLCAHPLGDTDILWREAQLLLGCAMLGLHRTPLLDEALTVNGVRILETVGLAESGDRFRISLLPVAPEDAVTYWTAGGGALRLAAYYAVTPVILEGRTPRKSGPRVLHYGISTIVAGAPRLEGSESTVTYTQPGAAAAEEYSARPAEVAIGGRVAFILANAGGDRIDLLLRAAGETDPHTADATWAVSLAGTRLLATIGTALAGRTVLPGPWTAQARLVHVLTLPDGRQREHSVVTNQTPFTITPRIDAVAGPVGGLWTVTGAVFTDPDPDHDPTLPRRRCEVEVWIGDAPLTPTAAAPTPGTFRIVDATTLTFRLPAATPAGAPLPLRIIVNGAESAPLWITP